MSYYAYKKIVTIAEAANEILFGKALVADMKKAGNQWPDSNERRDSSEFIVDLKN